MDNLKISKKDLNSIREFKSNVLREFPDAKFILYGSKAKGIAEEFSDIDILILLDREITTKIEEKIFEIGYAVELEYDVVFGIVVESKQLWMSPLSKAMPFHWNVCRDGITI